MSTSRRWTTSAVLLLSAASLGSLQAQPRVVRGVVLDTADRPVPAVSIVLAGRTHLSDDSGRFRLEIPHRNRVTFDIRRVGFNPSRFALVDGGDTTLEIMLFPAPVKLDVVKVTERIERSLEIHGFSKRKQEREKGAGSGYFLTFRDLDKITTPRVSLIFESNFASLRTTPTGTNSYGLVSIDRSGGYCATHIWLDGIRLEGLKDTGAPNMRVRPRGGGTPTPSSRPDVVNIDDILLPSAIAGIEYYQSGAEAPQQYRPVNGNCGVVLIWTKAG